MANQEFFVPFGGPASSQLLRIALIESGQTGLYRATFEAVSIDGTYPSLAASIAAAASRLAQADKAVIPTTSATPAIMPSAANNGAVFITNRTSTITTYVLPAAQVAGLNFRFVLGNVGTELLVNPAGTDTISIKGANTATAANITTAAGAGIKNTAATHILGDTIELCSDGVSQWFMTNQSGTWAAQ